MPARLVIRTFIAAVAIASGAAAQVGNQGWLAGWPQRAEKLESIKRIGAQKLPDDAKVEVIGWLERDARAVQEQFTRTGEGAGEAFGDYYIDLAQFVTTLKDRRSIRALSLAMDVSGRVSTTLAEFGDAAVEPVIAQLQNPLLRDSATYTLGKFVQGRTLKKCELSAANVARIREELLRLARDPSPSTRQNAVEALGHFSSDKEILSVIRNIAEHDPYSRKRTEDNLPDLFPVREAAKRALKRLEAGK
jgi:hypothetical protein